ncbi:probable LRR receptor-like serine threonine-kinase At3g47570 [Olea europaea subsp. europaea]|uniref:non-specific serine/threonine protein kinase n=1 Tax=Olea europaea subsp. europaea TaxID=158383 RepID=A0A8S0T0C4_OLEEU|nr:probable LRR receptor-like serine threonine-kinase At3g47570 [Olea europaea subsp. europaea]
MHFKLAVGKNVIFTLLTMLYLLIYVVASQNSSTEEYALLAFKSQISDPNKILAKNWSQGTSFCNWIGITCGKRHRRVRGLHLTTMGLQGTIPKEIGELSFLRSLIIGNNNFQGSIPHEVGNLSQLREIEMQCNELNGSIPSSFGSLENLQLLNLSHNILNGDIPNKILNISSLIEIDLTNNSLSGSLPTDICNNLPQLEKLIIASNQVSGNIPPSLGTCTNLELLSLSHNNFARSIPIELGNLSKLQILCLTRNNLIGTIPHSIGSLSNLKVLDVFNNSIHGQIPQTIFNHSMLQILGFTYNNISGNLPLSLANGLPNLEGLYFGGNRLSGEIPRWISNCSKLIVLELFNNSFSGHVPINLGNLHDLQYLYLFNNLLTNDPSMHGLDFLVSLSNCRHLKSMWIGNNFFDGTLPKALGNFSTSLQIFHAPSCGIKNMIIREIGNMSNLIWLQMGGNEFTGKIPDTLSQLSKLQKLLLDENNLRGSIPDNLCNLVNLYKLDLEKNQLSHQLPTCLGNLTSLREFYLANNSLTSTIPSTLWANREIQIMDLSYNFLNGLLVPEIGSVIRMRELYLSGNQFSGEIPSTIGKLQNLVYLTLSNNRLNGSIPESFGNLIALQSLDLSNNNLNGVIPMSMVKLEYLEYFNVSFNDLSGEIPNRGPFKNFTSKFFIGNKEFCGASQFKVKPCKENRTRLSSKTTVLKYILPSIVVIFSLAIGVVYLIRCRGRNKLLPALSTPPATIKRVSYYEVLYATNKFGKENLIDKGSIGLVYKGIFSNGMIAAIKVFNQDLEGAIKNFDTECQILCNVRHRNLVKVISSCSNLDLKALVLEYMPNGNLSKWMSSSNYFLNIAQRLEIMIDVACALEYLHHGNAYRIVHCDLKPSNVLLDENMVAHVADFGIAKLFTEDRRILMSKTLGTIGYMAPEYGSTGLISPMADVYSYGIMLIETFTNKKPTDDMFVGDFTIRRWVFESFRDEIMHIVDVDLLNAVGDNVRAKESFFRLVMGLALECTTDLFEERPNMKDILTRLRKIKIESS